MKNELIEQLSKAKDALDQMQSIQSAIVEIETVELPRLEEDIKKIEEKKEKIASYTFWYIFDIVGAILGTMVFPVICTFIGYIVGVIVRGVTSSLFMKFNFPGAAKKVEKAEAYYNEEMSKVLLEKEACFDKIDQLRAEFDAIEKPEVVADEYCESYIVGYLINVLKSGRADSLKEALNLYEDQKHKDDMIRLQEEQLEVANDNLEATQRTVALQEQTLVQQREALVQQKKALAQQKKQTRELKYANRLNSGSREFEFKKK